MPKLTCLCVLGTQWISGRWAASWRNSSRDEHSSPALTVSFQHGVFVRCFTSREREKEITVCDLHRFTGQMYPPAAHYQQDSGWRVEGSEFVSLCLSYHCILDLWPPVVNTLLPWSKHCLSIHALVNEAQKGFMGLLDYGSNQVFIKILSKWPQGQRITCNFKVQYNVIDFYCFIVF